MAKQNDGEGKAPAAVAEPQRVRKFEAPAELAPQWHAHTVTEEYIQGWVESKDVRALLDAFGVQDRADIQFPFQYMKKRSGEIWRIRIEVAAHHTVDGQVLLCHQWAYSLDFPERQSGAQ